MNEIDLDNLLAQMKMKNGQATIEIERTWAIEQIIKLCDLIKTKESKKDKDLRRKAYSIISIILNKQMLPEYCQFLVDRLGIETDKYVLSSMLDDIQHLLKNIPKEVNIDLIIECTRNDKWQIRLSAISALRACNTEQSREAARYWIKKEDEKTFDYEITYANASLGYIGEIKDIKILELHTHTRKRDIKISAFYAIYNIKKRYGMVKEKSFDEFYDNFKNKSKL